MSGKETKKVPKSKGNKKQEISEASQVPLQPVPEKKKSSKASKNVEEKNAIDDNIGWEEVKNMKRLKAEIRKAKKVILAEANARELKSDVIPELSAPRFSSPVPSSPVVKPKGEQQPKKKKAKSTKAGTRVISNERALVEEITKILNNVPTSFRLTVSAVGDRLQELTGASWNKKFKKHYGNLKSFLENRPEFHVDSKDQVFIKSEHEQQARVVDLKPKIKPKKPVLTVKQPKLRLSEQDNSFSPGEIDTGFSCFRIVFVVALVLVVLLFTLIFVDSGSNQLFEQFKKQFRP